MTRNISATGARMTPQYVTNKSPRRLLRRLELQGRLGLQRGVAQSLRRPGVQVRHEDFVSMAKISLGSFRVL